jgi:hypothetical protein
VSKQPFVIIAGSMPEEVTLAEARSLLGGAVLGPEEVVRVFGTIESARGDVPVPYKRADLEAAARLGEMLVLRVPRADGADLTIARMIERFPDAFDQGLLRQAGYQLKSDWGIELEPLAQTETSVFGWALVSKEILGGTRNLAYAEQTDYLQRHAAAAGVAARAMRRRTAVEAVYDTLLAFTARAERLLEKTWDWTSSKTLDGGYLNVGGFGSKGLQVLSFSTAVRHGALGVCPMREPQR